MLSLRLYTDPVLHKKCEKVSVFDEELQTLAGGMLLAMNNYNGVGLAANQVGVTKQLCVLDVENRTKKMALVNPTVIAKSKVSKKDYEGCLSCPNFVAKIKRPVEVVVKANLLTGEEVTFKFTDFDARIIQHEIDHLNGKIISDAALPLIKY